MEEVIKKVKEIRKYIDSIIKALATAHGSRQMSAVNTKLQEARMWTGKVLAGVGNEESPYVTGKEMTGRSVDTIVATTDLSEKALTFPNKNNHVDVVDFIREWIGQAFETQKEINRSLIGWKSADGGLGSEDAGKLVLVRLAEARMWAGEELRFLKG